MPRGSRRNRKRQREQQPNCSSNTNIQVSWYNGEGIVPETSNYAKIPASLQTLWNSTHLKTPTPIQLQTWNGFLHHTDDNHHLISIAPTGSGKTLSYGLLQPSLILVPTRELVLQVSQSLAAVMDCGVITVYGGSSYQQHQTWSDNNNTVVVATPGRLLQLLETQKAPRDWQPRLVVLDEADQLATHKDLSSQVSSILDMLHPKCSQSSQPLRMILTSATWPSNTEQWKAWLQQRPTLLIQLDAVQLSPHPRVAATTARIPSHIKQVVHVCSDHKKVKKLLGLLDKETTVAWVFFNTVKTLEMVAQLLSKHRHSFLKLHGQLHQSQREQTLRSLRKGGAYGMLLTTDVAARGLHDLSCKCVIQYDFPSNLQTYIHRCGRAKQKSYGFFPRRLHPLAPHLIEVLEASQQIVDPNLRALIDQESTRNRSKPKKVVTASTNPEAVKMKNEDGMDHDGDDIYPELAANRIVLQRADNVSEASSSDDSENDE